LPGRPAQPLPYLGYAPGAYLGQVTDLLLKQAGTAIHLDRVYETDMAEGLKVMALEGHGVAFLPHSAVRKELRARKLVSPAAADMQGLEIAMEVRAYRGRPSGKQPAKGTAQSLWLSWRTRRARAPAETLTRHGPVACHRAKPCLLAAHLNPKLPGALGARTMRPAA
jgi:DNA-binding transcriptional LysR family regulator